MRFFDCLGSVLVVSGLAFTTSGCFVHDESSSTGGHPPPPTEASVSIDKGGALTTDPGQGVAILVEYVGPSPTTAGASRWNVETTCDTLKSTYACTFDIYARSAGIKLIDTPNAKSDDYVDQATGLLHAGFNTSSDIPGFTFDVPQGQNVELEAYLDSQSAAQYVFFQGSGVTHAGVPTNPVLFVPAG